MNWPSVVIVVPCRASQGSIQHLVDSALAAIGDYPGVANVLLIGNIGDPTWIPIQNEIKSGRVAVHEVSTDPQFRDSNIKRLIGGQIAVKNGAEVLFFTDTKIRLPKDTLTRGVSLLLKHQADSVGRTFRRCPGQDAWWARVMDEGLVTDVPRFGPGRVLNPAKTLNMPITACLFMTSVVFERIQANWPKEASRHPSHEDTRICIEILNEGFRIYVTDALSVFHAHRSESSAVLLKWARSGAAIANMRKSMPDNAFVTSRTRKAFFLLVLELLAYVGAFMVLLTLGWSGLWWCVFVFCGTMVSAGMVNALKVKDVRAMLYPWGTMLLIGSFEFAFLITMVSKKKEYNPSDLLQIY